MPLNDLGKNKALDGLDESVSGAITHIGVGRTMRRTGVVVGLAASAVVGWLMFGPPVMASVAGLETKVASGTANANSIKSLAVSCSSGKVAVGGGVSFSNPGADINVITSAPIGAAGDGSDNGWGWVGEFNNHESVSKTVYTWVVCADA